MPSPEIQSYLLEGIIMELLDLPHDVLFDIFEFLPVEDFINTIQTCRQIHHHAKSRIEVHQFYPRRYSSIILKDPAMEDYLDQSSWSVDHPLDLLYIVEADPLIATYVSHLKFDCPGFMDGLRLPPYDIALDLTEQQVEARELRQMELRSLQECSFLGDASREIWKKHVQLFGVKDFAAHEMMLSLVVSLLPNLRRLQLWNVPTIAMDWRMFSFCLGAKFTSSRLGILELVQCDGLDHIVPFLQLPNLRELRLYRTDVDYHINSSPEFEATRATHVSKLEVMRFHDCSIYSSIILLSMLTVFPACHTLEVSYDLALPSLGVGPRMRTQRSSEIEKVFSTFREMCDEYPRDGRNVHIRIRNDALWRQMICTVSTIRKIVESS